jgi:RNA polymerase sigma-70 factor, ECF subfamily
MSKPSLPIPMTPSEQRRDATDEKLVELVLRDPDRYRSIVARYERPLTRYIMRIATLPKEDVEDVLQSVFIKTYENLRDFDPTLKFSSWIYRITHNETVSHLRKLSARPQTTLATDDEDDTNVFVSALNLEHELDRTLVADDVRKVLATMDPKYREVLVLRYLEGKEYSEIADILKRPVGTVGTLILRAKAQFKKRSEKHTIAFA